MLCSRCKKRPATVFVTTNKDDNSQPQGLCIVCAKELGIKPVNDLMEKMGITEEDVDNLSEQMAEIMNLEGDTDHNEENFVPGGATTFPFIKNLFSGGLFGNGLNAAEQETKAEEGTETQKKPKRKHLDNYCYNLTQKAARGELDRIIGRDNEIARVIQILSRRTKNNPCLIGEPGVGKTAIAEGLAIKIVEGKVPQRLKRKEVYLLDLTALIAGTQFRGQFESRIKGLIDEVKSAGNIILFIDEVHNIVGAGDTESSSMNAANILKPALSRGEVQVIGATTFAEYRKYIEKDSALERRFQPVTIEEPSIDGTIELLKGIRTYYEDYHRVKISDNLIRKVAILSERYITDRFLPDKAIDLMDEACACAALRNKDMEEYDKIVENIDALKNLETKMMAPENENIDYEELAKIRSDIDKLDIEKEKLLPSAIGSEVSEDDVAHVIELWTGIPASKVKETEIKKLSKIEDRLKLKIIGQDEAVDIVAAATKRSRVQISPRRRPASFIFVGPTGVGKTELVKVLSEELFDTPETLIRLDMSEFMEKHSVSRIIGAPPGYVGYDESGQMTEKVRRRPYSVLLFDEIEKAHPDVMNILLQILDEGKITDAQGRVVNFENTIIVMTSNAGSSTKGGSVGFGKSQNDMTKEKALMALSDFLRPEFLSRIDEVVVFKSLDLKAFKKISKLMLNEYVETLKEKGIDLTYSEEVSTYLAENSVEGKSGARDLRNLTRKKVEDKIASVLIEGGEDIIKTVGLSVSDNDIVVNIG
ncbi:MAG: ATP-dependent Clp protease ATP-binding subunit ClpE [Eubacteriales bacterium SKADARSKE-1]|nr:ATP-dependent Clp protease ATP-binding subunit ClpE [Eubacteriales bacterium SKADARSKE-1]